MKRILKTSPRRRAEMYTGNKKGMRWWMAHWAPGLMAPPRSFHSCYLWVRKGWIPTCTVFVSLSFSWNSTLCLPQERESPLARSILSHKASKQEKWAGHSFTLVSSARPASAQNRLSHSLTFTCVMMKQFLENLAPLLSLWFNLCIQNFIPFLVLHLFPLKTGEHQRKRGTNRAGLYGDFLGKTIPPTLLSIFLLFAGQL